MRIAFFREVRRKYTLPTLEMRDDRPVRECFNESTLWPARLNQLRVLVDVPRKCQLISCRETGRREKPKVALALRRAREG